MVTAAPSARAKTLKATLNDMSKAAKIHRKFSAGRPMNELQTAREALWIAKAFDQQLKAEMAEQGLQPDDTRVLLCYMTPDLVILSTLAFKAGREEEIYSVLTGPGKCAVMVGLIFGIHERDPKVTSKPKFKDPDGVWLLGQKAFLNTEIVRSALLQRIVQEGDSLQI
jgi:hypothetical protein